MEQPLKKNTRRNNLKHFYHLFKSDLSVKEIEGLIKRDVPGLYGFYSREMEKPDDKKNRFFRSLLFVRNFFLAFLLKLSAARRLFYSIALFVFFYGMFIGMDNWMLLSFIILNILLALEVAEKLMAKDELEVAREIQMSLMPRKAPAEVPGDIACISEPAREVGGDYYDFLQPGNSKKETYIVIADVKGKGMAAALYIVRVQALLQYLAGKHFSPREILIALNRNIGKILSKDYFISMALTRIDDQFHFTYSRAGHMPLLHYQSQKQNVEILEPGGIAVGLEKGTCFDATIEETTLHLHKNDILVYYTDGVVETMNGSQNQYGESALCAVIIQNAHKTAKGIKEAILKNITEFRGTAPPHDDLTLVIVKI